MTKIDIRFVQAGLLFLLAGIAIGMWMGITQQFHFTNFHAHVNLVGFLMTVLYGIIHRSWPELRQSGLAAIQFWVHIAGAAILSVGKYLVCLDPGDDAVVAVGALVVAAGALLFTGLFFAKAGKP